MPLAAAILAMPFVTETTHPATDALLLQDARICVRDRTSPAHQDRLVPCSIAIWYKRGKTVPPKQGAK